MKTCDASNSSEGVENKDKIGDVLVKLGHLTSKQLHIALHAQNRQNNLGNQILIGDIIKKLGFVETQQLIIELHNQQIRLRVGEILLRDEHISEKALNNALNKRSSTNRVLLEYLVRRGEINEAIRNDVISEQEIYDITANNPELLDFFLKKQKDNTPQDINTNNNYMPDSVIVR